MTPLRKIKKVELHRHLEGSVRLQTVLDVAQDAGIRLPTTDLEELKHHALIIEKMADLETVLNKFMLVQSALATPAIIRRVSYENCIDAFNDGIRVLELRYSPSFINLNHPSLDYDMIHKAVVDGVAQAEKELDGKMAVGLICIISRDQPPGEATKTVDFAAAHSRSFVGFDLAGSEVGYPVSSFRKHFDKARRAGLGITVHSGEARVNEAPGWVKEAVTELGASRIGHGVQIIHSTEVMDFVKKNDVTLEVCPTSNILTSAFDTLSDHPIRKFLDYGIRVALSSDDPHIFGIDLTHEYEVLEKELKFTTAEFDRMNAYALEASFISDKQKLTAWNA